MDFAHAYRTSLPPHHAAALETASEMLLDESLDQLADLLVDTHAPVATSSLVADLPPKHLPRYTREFLKKYVVCLSTVIWKLGHPRAMRPACVAEELAARALVNRAEVVLDEQGIAADFDAFTDTFFEDLDHDLLFEGAVDGVERSALAAYMDLAHLSFDEWFVPFQPNKPVHPYVTTTISQPPGDARDVQER